MTSLNRKIRKRSSALTRAMPLSWNCRTFQGISFLICKMDTKRVGRYGTQV